MFDFNWQRAYEDWDPQPGDDSADAFKAGWLAAMAQIIAMVEDERQQAEPHKYALEHEVDEAYERMRADLLP